MRIFGADTQSLISSNLGANIRFNRRTHQIEPGLGLVIKSKLINLSTDYNLEANGEKLLTMTAGLRVWNFAYDFTHFKNSGSDSLYTSIHSFTLSIKSLFLTYAIRTQKDAQVNAEIQNALNMLGSSYNKTHQLLGFNFQLNSHLRLGYFNNYILNEKNTF